MEGKRFWLAETARVNVEELESVGEPQAKRETGK
jgi:hypothetical protein